MKYLFLFLSICLISCQEPPLPPVVEGEPFFEVAASIDNVDKKLAAGIDAYYLYTSFDQDEQNVYRLEGKLGKIACENCGPQLRIVFRDIQARGDGSKPKPEDILLPKFYDFYGSGLDTTAYETRFEAKMDNPDDFSFFWELGDGNTQSQRVFTHTYTAFPNSYAVQLQVLNANCSSEISQTIDVPKASCFPEISSQFLGNETEHNFDTPPLSGLSYAWDLGDGSRKAGASINHSFPARGAYTVCVLASGNDCMASHCRNIEVGEVKGCAVNFSYQTMPVIEMDSLGLGEVEVFWMDENGATYSTIDEAQPPSSFFELTEIAPYEDNEQGDPSLAYTFSLNCKLFGDGEEKELTITNGKMAVAYPK